MRCSSTSVVLSACVEHAGSAIRSTARASGITTSRTAGHCSARRSQASTSALCSAASSDAHHAPPQKPSSNASQILSGVSAP
jgi:hypothetical protein